MHTYTHTTDKHKRCGMQLMSLKVPHYGVHLYLREAIVGSVVVTLKFHSVVKIYLIHFMMQVYMTVRQVFCVTSKHTLYL